MIEQRKVNNSIFKNKLLMKLKMIKLKRNRISIYSIFADCYDEFTKCNLNFPKINSILKT